MIEVFHSHIKEWPEASRGALAAEAVKALAITGSPKALLLVDSIAQKFKYRQVKVAAETALKEAASELGISKEELSDRVVPTLGFDSTMSQNIDYGSRHFKVYLGSSLELEIFDEGGKRLKTLPTPGKKDDEEKAQEAYKAFKAMKKQLKTVVAGQRIRLEGALMADRRWQGGAWISLFVNNPIMHQFAIGLIWGVYDSTGLRDTFRYMEDGSFNTPEEEEFSFTKEDMIGLVHPLELSPELMSAWKQQLEDYEIAQPIKQLERRTYSLLDSEIGAKEFSRYKDKKINALTLLGRLTKAGWYKGAVQDGGMFYEFFREDVTGLAKDSSGHEVPIGNAVELRFSGMYAGGGDEEVTLEEVIFYSPGSVKRASYQYDDAKSKAIALEEVNKRYFSEVVYQLEKAIEGA